MRTRLSSVLAGVGVVAIAVTGCASSAGGQALGLEELVSGTPPASASPGPPMQAAGAPDASASPAQDQPMLVPAEPADYRIGDPGPGGGIVFYDAGAPQHWGRYLEAAPAGWSGGAGDPRMPLCKGGTFLAPSTGLGAGARNTRTIADACKESAAATVLAYAGGGKTDWFVPSKEELNLLYRQSAVVGGLLSDTYWSSSKADADYAWNQLFGSGRQEYAYMNFAMHIRPVRTF